MSHSNPERTELGGNPSLGGTLNSLPLTGGNPSRDPGSESSNTGGTATTQTKSSSSKVTAGKGGAGNGGEVGKPMAGSSTMAVAGRSAAAVGGRGNQAGQGGVSFPGGSTQRSGSGGLPVAGARAVGGATSDGGRSTVVAASGTTLITVNARTRYQTFEGWGTSLAWWGYQIGGWSMSKRSQFLSLIVDPVAGLGYNIFRYNIGGGDAPSHDHMDANREMPGFLSSSGQWDWSADQRQTAVLTELVAKGQNVIVEAFANSPPYFMTKSGCASGNTDGTNNLKDDAYDDFADYLTEVTKHYRDELKIAFRTLEPMNEPNANWWKSNGGQEGCHFSASNQQQMIKALAASLSAKGLTEIQISASDENSMDDAYSIMGGYDATTLAAIAQMNVHSYAGSKRSQLHTLATSKNKRLWQSESGPLSVDLASNTDSALFMAGRIIQDLRELQPVAWIEWQVVDPSPNWTSFTVNDAQQTSTPVKRFYMQSGFTRYIRPGATFIDIDNADMVAATSADGRTMAIVARNPDSKATHGFTFDLTSLPSVGGSVEVFRTSAKEDLVKVEPIPVKDYSFTATLPAYSVTTFVVAL